MGRPREHDARTAAALLDAAEVIVARDGAAALSLRHLAVEAGTTTRAVYSVFGSKAALIVALGARAFDWLADALDALPVTGDAAADVVEAGAGAFRRLVVDHPALFTVGVQHAEVPPDLASKFGDAAGRALTRLESRMARLDRSGLLGGRAAAGAACEFHALCEGLAALHLRGALRAGEQERIWRDALMALVAGFAAAPSGVAVPGRRPPGDAPGETLRGGPERGDHR